MQCCGVVLLSFDKRQNHTREDGINGDVQCEEQIIPTLHADRPLRAIRACDDDTTEKQFDVRRPTTRSGGGGGGAGGGAAGSSGWFRWRQRYDNRIVRAV